MLAVLDAMLKYSSLLHSPERPRSLYEGLQDSVLRCHALSLDVAVSDLFKVAQGGCDR